MRFRTEAAPIFLPIIACPLLSDLDLVWRRVACFDGVIAVIGLGGIGKTASAEQAEKTGKEHQKEFHSNRTIILQIGAFHRGRWM